MKRLFVVLSLIMLLFGCTEAPSEPVPPEAPEEPAQEYLDSEFSLEYPSSWEPDLSQSPESEFFAGDSNCHVLVRKLPYPPKQLILHLEEYSGEVADGNRLDFAFEHEGIPFNSYNLFSYCECDTNWVTVNCFADADQSVVEDIFSSVSCSYVAKEPETGMGIPGIVPTYFGADLEDFVFSYCDSIGQAKEAGASIAHRYYSWGEMEPSKGNYNWTVSDFFYDIHAAQKMPISADIQVVYTNQLGDLPRDMQFTSLNESRFKERFADFMIAFLDRYPKIKYVEIGNEVDIYLNIHPEQVYEFKDFYSYVHDEIKAEHPNVKVGTIFAYHAAKQSNSTWIIEELNDIGDFNGFTVYVHQDKYYFNGSMDDVKPYFDEIDGISGDKPYAFTETGWSSSSTLGSSEEMQSEYVGEVFSILKERKNRVEFFTWYMSHDISDSFCSEVAEGFITEDIEFLLDNQEYMQNFEDFICTQGLRTADDEPKLAWNTWIEEIDRFD